MIGEPSPLYDELRKLLLGGRYFYDQGGHLAFSAAGVESALLEFENKHPYLSDETVYCRECGRPGIESECLNPSWDEEWDGVPMEVYDADGTLTDYYHVCPTCAEDLE